MKPSSLAAQAGLRTEMGKVSQAQGVTGRILAALQKLKLLLKQKTAGRWSGDRRMTLVGVDSTAGDCGAAVFSL